MTSKAHESQSEFRVVANRANELLLLAESGRTYTLPVLKKLGLIVVGDKLVCSLDETGEPVRALQRAARSSTLNRTDRSGRAKPLAANISQVVVVTAPVPIFDPLLIDQYLVAAADIGCAATLVINKQDLLDTQTSPIADELQALYASLGIRVVRCSIESGDGIEELVNCLRDQITILVGQSGVGKSTLISTLVKDQAIKIGSVSESKGLGKHTTTVAHWYRLPGNGAIIDSAGVRQFGQQHLQIEQIQAGFSEIQQFSGCCRFNNCSHAHEPECAVQQAVSDGDIQASRFENFQKIVSSHIAD